MKQFLAELKRQNEENQRAMTDSIATLQEENQALRIQNAEQSRVHQQQMQELLTQISSKQEPEPTNKETDNIDLDNLDFNTPEGRRQYEQYLENKFKLGTQHTQDIQSQLEALNSGIMENKKMQFLNTAEQELRIPVEQIMGHPKWNEYLSKTKNPLTQRSYDQEFKDANDRGDISIMTNIVKQFADTDMAKEAYKEITGQDFLPTSPNGTGSIGEQEFNPSEPQLSESLQQIAKETYGEDGDFQTFMDNLNK